MSVIQFINQDVAKITPYHPGRPVEEVAREFGIQAESICKLASNESPMGTSPLAIEAIKRSAGEMYRYPDGGVFYLRQKLSAKLGIMPEMLIFGNGSNELIQFIGHSLILPGASALMSSFAFVIYKLVTKMHGGDVIEIPTLGLAHDLEAMVRTIQPNTRVVFICNPNNPTSSMLHEEQIDAFMEQVPDDVLVVFDEAYAEIALKKMPDTMKYVRQGRDVIILRTFSKSYGLAGLRIGYGIAKPELIEAFEKPRQPFNVNRMAQVAATAALDDAEFVARVKSMSMIGAEQITGFCRENALQYEVPHANFMLIKVGDGAGVFEEMQKRGVIVRPMKSYLLPEWIRVSFGTEEENERFISTMREVLECL